MSTKNREGARRPTRRWSDLALGESFCLRLMRGLQISTLFSLALRPLGASLIFFCLVTLPAQANDADAFSAAVRLKGFKVVDYYNSCIKDHSVSQCRQALGEIHQRELKALQFQVIALSKGEKIERNCLIENGDYAVYVGCLESVATTLRSPAR